LQSKTQFFLHSLLELSLPGIPRGFVLSVHKATRSRLRRMPQPEP
jgi:hypothetical protein